ncbi:MAG: sensor histidine kinase, partial [Bacteroidetes bacterium]
MHWLNWKSFLVIVAIGIVIGTLFFTQHIAEKIALEEKQKVLLWVDAQKTLLNSTDSLSLNLAAKISAENDDIPIIETNEKDSLTKNYLNLDSFAVAQNPQYLQEKLVEFKQLHAPLELVLSDSPYIANKYYYGESMLQKEARYYPIIQLLVVAIFILVLALAQRQQFKSTQNQLWAGLAKETAHQLGTPITSLKGWLEVLQTEP